MAGSVPAPSSASSIRSRTTPGSTSVLGLAYYEGNKNGLVGTQLDGVDATIDNLKNGTYKLQAFGHMYTKGDPTGLTKTFFVSVNWKDGQYQVGSRMVDGSLGWVAPNSLTDRTPDREVISRLIQFQIGREFGITSSLASLEGDRAGSTPPASWQ